MPKPASVTPKALTTGRAAAARNINGWCRRRAARGRSPRRRPSTRATPMPVSPAEPAVPVRAVFSGGATDSLAEAAVAENEAHADDHRAGGDAEVEVQLLGDNPAGGSKGDEAQEIHGRCVRRRDGETEG